MVYVCIVKVPVWGGWVQSNPWSLVGLWAADFANIWIAYVCSPSGGGTTDISLFPSFQLGDWLKLRAGCQKGQVVADCFWSNADALCWVSQKRLRVAALR